jgi:hypothetical protein
MNMWCCCMCCTVVEKEYNRHNKKHNLPLHHRGEKKNENENVLFFSTQEKLGFFRFLFLRSYLVCISTLQLAFFSSFPLLTCYTIIAHPFIYFCFYLFLFVYLLIDLLSEQTRHSHIYFISGYFPANFFNSLNK